MSPLVSVLITVYHRIEFLAEAIESALQQSFPDREIVVVDDSGKRTAEEICRPYLERDLIRYRANGRTLGVALSLRDAMAAASGKYISILNDDDVWETDFLSTLVPALEASETRSLAFSDHWIINETGAVDAGATDANTRTYGRDRLPEGEVADVANLVLEKNGVPLAMAALFRKDALELKLLTAEVGGAYDFWISCLLAARAGKFYYVPARLTRYRVHRRMETGRRALGKSDEQVFIFSEMRRQGWFPRHDELLKRKLAGALFRSGRNRLCFNQPSLARRFFKDSFALSPGWKSAAAIASSFLPLSWRARLKLSSDSVA